MNLKSTRAFIPASRPLIGAAVGAALLATSGLTYAVGLSDVGRAVSNIGGNALHVRAADAIFVTCAALDGLPTATKTPDQTALNLRCADMSQQALFLDPDPANPAIPPSDTFGLGRLGDTGRQRYFALLQQFSGEEASAQGRYATEGAVSQFKSIAARLSAIRRGNRNNGIAFNLQGVDVYSIADHDSADDNPSYIGGAAGDADADRGWAWFGNVEYGFGDHDAKTVENEYDAKAFGAVLGVDYAFNDQWVVGGAINIVRAEIDFDREDASGIEGVSGGGMDTDSESLSLFMNFTDGAMYASAIGSYGQGDIDMKRIINISLPTSGGAAGVQLPLLATADSNTESTQLGLEAQVGYTFGEGVTTWDLYGGLSLVDLEIDGFRETGTILGLTFGSQEVDSFEGFVGASLRHVVSTGAGVFVPYATVEFRNEFDDDGRTISARYNLTPRAPGELFQGETDDFEIPTEDLDSNYFDVAVGVSAQFGNNLAAFAQYSTLLALKDTSAHLFTVGIRGSF